MQAWLRARTVNAELKWLILPSKNRNADKQAFFNDWFINSRKIKMEGCFHFQIENMIVYQTMFKNKPIYFTT